MSTSPPIVPALSQGGTVTGNLSVTGSLSAGSSPGGPLMELVATTGVAGFALTGATPNVVTWTAPNDGNLHRVLVLGQQRVTSAETGGAVGVFWTNPDGSVIASPGDSVFPGGSGAGHLTYLSSRFVEAGTTITVGQTSALTVGAAVVWAELWAS